jgi:membrane protease YdiL (CAAX protease family)
VTICTHNSQNKQPMKKVTHTLVTLTFTFACVSLWAMLTAVANLSPHWSQAPPAFTRLCLSLSPFLLALPVPVVAYCVFALIRKHSTQETGTAFIAWTMTALCLVFFPVLFAVFLPCFQLLETR